MSHPRHSAVGKREDFSVRDLTGLKDVLSGFQVKSEVRIVKRL